MFGKILMSSLSGVAVRRCSFKESFLKISQYSKESTCAGVFFNEAAGLQACNFIKKRLQHTYFPVNIAKFLKTPFLQTPSVAAFAL